MPRYLPFVLACFVTFTAGVLAKAQERYLNVNTELKAMSLGSYSAFTVTVEGANAKLAASEWKSYLKEFGTKTKRSKPEDLKAEGVTINSIGGADLLDIYAEFSERGSEVKVYVWISERGNFMGPVSTSRDVAAVENLLREYAILLRRAAVQQELEVEQKELDKVQKRLDLLARDIERSEREIENARRTIEKAEASIVANQAATAETQLELERKNEELQAVLDKLAAVGTIKS